VGPLVCWKWNQVSWAHVEHSYVAMRAVAVHQARVDGVTWIGHVDTDELVYPAGSPGYSMHQLLDDIPDHVRTRLTFIHTPVYPYIILGQRPIATNATCFPVSTISPVSSAGVLFRARWAASIQLMSAFVYAFNL
jgi:hypothetical protein